MNDYSDNPHADKLAKFPCPCCDREMTMKFKYYWNLREDDEVMCDLCHEGGA